MRTYSIEKPEFYPCPCGKKSAAAGVKDDCRSIQEIQPDTDQPMAGLFPFPAVG